MTFERLNYNTRIHYELRPSCLSLNRLREIADDYCSWDNETAVVPAGFTNCVQVRKDTTSQDCLDWVICALKVASYFTLIIPALMYLAKYLLRSSPFYVIAPLYNPQLQQMSWGGTNNIVIGQSDWFRPENARFPYVNIVNKKIQLIKNGSAKNEKDQDTLWRAVIHYYAQSALTDTPLLASTEPLIVEQFLETTIADPFVRHALRIAYPDHKFERSLQSRTIILPPEQNAIEELHKTVRVRVHRPVNPLPVQSFKDRVVHTLVLYLDEKEHPSPMEKWICKALKNENFRTEEFNTLDVHVKKTACLIAKFFYKKTFWSQAEKCLKPSTQTLLQHTVPDVFSIDVMAYVGQPHMTASTCRTWAYFTRSMYKQLALAYFADPKKRQYIRLAIAENIKQNSDYSIMIIYKIKIIIESLKGKLDESDGQYFKRMRTYINTLDYPDIRNLLETIQIFISNKKIFNIKWLLKEDYYDLLAGTGYL